MPVRDVGASRELDCSNRGACGGLKQNGVHASEPKYCTKPQHGKHVVRKMVLIN